MKNVFLSYSLDDRAIADVMRKSLTQHGFEVWSPDRIEPGELWPAAIARALEEADSFVVLVGNNTDESQWRTIELGAAISSGRPIVPVLTRRDAEIPRLLGDRQYIDATAEKDFESGADRASEALLKWKQQDPKFRESAIEFVDGTASLVAAERLAYENKFRTRGIEAADRFAKLGVLAVSISLTATLTGIFVQTVGAQQEVIAVMVPLAAGSVGYFLGAHGRNKN